MQQWLAHHPERGAGLVEYLLLVAFVAFVAMAAVTLVGEHTADKVKVLGTQIEQSTGSSTTTQAGSTTSTTCAGQSGGHGQGSNCR